MSWKEIEVNNDANNKKLVTSNKQIVLLEYCWVAQRQKFVNMNDLTLEMNKAQFNEIYKDFMPKRTSIRKEILPSDFITNTNKETNAVWNMDMLPQYKENIVEVKPGIKTFNLCASSKRYNLEGQVKEPTMFLNHLSYLLDENKDAVNYVLKWITHLIFKPETKMTTGLMISGGQGTGKTTLTDIISELVGINNSIAISPAEIKSDFQSFLIGKRLIVVEEIHENHNFQLYNKIKHLFTNKKIFINPKNENGYEINNHAHFIFLSNHANPLPIDADDRRLFYWHSKAVKKDAKNYSELYSFIDNNGIYEIAKYLYQNILPTIQKEFAHVQPLITDDKVEAGISSENPLKTFILEGLEEKEGMFADDVWFTWQDLVESLPDEFNKIKSNSALIGSVFKECELKKVRHTIDSKKMLCCWFDKSTYSLNWKDNTKAGRKKIKEQKMSYMQIDTFKKEWVRDASSKYGL